MISVLLIGYGKIGAIKASLWRRLGCTVNIVDSSLERRAKAEQDGFSAHQSVEAAGNTLLDTIAVVDISVPSGYHATSLATSLPLLRNCRAALVEKPLVSSRQELRMLKQVIAEHGQRVSLFVNESYHMSNGLLHFKDYLQGKSRPQKIIVTFTKDRLPDIRAGRFVDKELGPFGIEVPHMLACLKGLGLSDIRLLKSDWYQNVGGEMGSEGVVCELNADGIPVQLVEVLGPFRVGPSLELSPDHQAPVRRDVQAWFNDGTEAVLEFDPARGLERYKSRLTTPEGTVVIEDNHMKNVLSSIAEYATGSGQSDPALANIRINKAVEETRSLFELHRRAVVTDFAAEPNLLTEDVALKASLV